jgi:hypothetical protein
MLGGLLANLRAGLRLAFFRRVGRGDFRVGVAELLVLVVASSLLDVGIDYVKYGPDAEFSWLGVAGETYAFGVVTLLAGVLSVLYRRATLVLSVPVVLFASYPSLQFIHLLPRLADPDSPVYALLALVEEYLLLGWAVVLFVRSVAVALEATHPHRWLRATAGGLLLLAPLWFGSVFAPDVPWWRSQTVANGADPGAPNPASEPVLEAQKVLLDQALGALEDGRAGTDLYAVGFAASGLDAFRADVLAAIKVLDERWVTDGRSITLVNHPASLLETPMATVSNLRATLEELHSAIDPDEDVVLLYFAGNGRDGGSIEVALPPLDLVPLTPQGVRRMLDEAGIRWRIIIVSACHSGAWRDALAGETTVVITATGDGDAGEGCRLEADGTAFGNALFGTGFAEADTVTGAFARARERLLTRPAADPGDPAAGPQLSVGTAIAAKLKEIERGRAVRRTDRSV